MVESYITLVHWASNVILHDSWAQKKASRTMWGGWKMFILNANVPWHSETITSLTCLTYFLNNAFIQHLHVPIYPTLSLKNYVSMLFSIKRLCFCLFRRQNWSNMFHRLDLASGTKSKSKKKKKWCLLLDTLNTHKCVSCSPFIML